MDINIEKECSALGGLFQQVMNDMKSSSPVWEDFLNKSTKLHNTLKATLLATTAFLDAFQRVADLATGSKGATREIGSALTRLCMRHRSIENKMKAFTTCIMEVLVSPMQEKMEEWKKSLVILDKDHQKDYKKARAEIKKASSDTIRLQKKAKKGNKSDIQTRLDSALHDVNDKYQILEETEQNAVRSALIEERSRFCVFISCLKPVVDEEINMLTEVTHLQEILQQLCLQAGDPYNLPSASEQIISDIKGSDGQQWSYQTPPSSPSSLGSRKSSMCSISSINSSSSGGTNMSSPTHHFRNRSSSQSLPPGHQMPGVTRLSSVSSQDSGFTSQDTLFMKPGTPPSLGFNKSSLDDSTGSGGADSNATTPSPSYSSSSASTWANWPDPPGMPAFPTARQDSTGSSSSGVGGQVAERPHTISSAYEKSHHSRPSLSAQMFEPPGYKELALLHKQQQQNSSTSSSGSSDYAVPFVLPKSSAKPGSRPDSGEYMKPPIPGPKPKGKPVAPPTVPDFSVPQNAGEPGIKIGVAGVIQYPAYVNQDDLAKMAAEMVKGQGRGHDDIPEEDEGEDEDEVTTPTPRNTHRSLSMPAQEDGIIDEELDISGLSRVIDELTASTAELHTMCGSGGPSTTKSSSADKIHESSRNRNTEHYQRSRPSSVIGVTTTASSAATHYQCSSSSLQNNVATAGNIKVYESINIQTSKPQNPVRRSMSEVTHRRPVSNNSTFQQLPASDSHYMASPNLQALNISRSRSPSMQENHYHSVMLQTPPPDAMVENSNNNKPPPSSSIHENHYQALSSFMTPPPTANKIQHTPQQQKHPHPPNSLPLGQSKTPNMFFPATPPLPPPPPTPPTPGVSALPPYPESQAITAQSLSSITDNNKSSFTSTTVTQPTSSLPSISKETATNGNLQKSTGDTVISNGEGTTIDKDQQIKEITDSLDQTTCELTAAIKELELSTAALEMSTSYDSATSSNNLQQVLTSNNNSNNSNRNSMQGSSSGYGTCSDDTIASDLDDTLTSIDAEINQLFAAQQQDKRQQQKAKYATLPRKPKDKGSSPQRSQSFRMASTASSTGDSMAMPANGPVMFKPGGSNGPSSGIRRSSSTLSHGSKPPPPPVRRNSSVTSTGGFKKPAVVPASKSAPASKNQTPQDHQPPPGGVQQANASQHKRSRSDSESGNANNTSGGDVVIRRPTVLNTNTQHNVNNRHTIGVVGNTDKQQQQNDVSNSSKSAKTVSMVMSTSSHDDVDHDLPPPPPPEMLAMDLAQCDSTGPAMQNGAIVVPSDNRSVLEKAHIYDSGKMDTNQDAGSSSSSNQNDSGRNVVKRQGSVVNSHKDVIQALNQQLSVVAAPHSPPNVCNSSSGMSPPGQKISGGVLPQQQTPVAPTNHQSLHHQNSRSSSGCLHPPSNSTASKSSSAIDYDITPTPQSPGSSLLAQIESGVKLRKSAKSDDKSGPRVS